MLSRIVAIFHVNIVIELIPLVCAFFSHIWHGIMVGVKIPWPGYLDPHPVICFLKLNKYIMLSKTVAIFHVIIVIKLIPLV